MITLLSLFITVSCATADQTVTGKTYSFSVPKDVTFEGKDKLEFYTFKWGDAAARSLFMLNINPAPLNVKMMKPMVDMMIISFEDQMKKQGLETELGKKRREIELGPFKGTEIEFTIKHSEDISITQYMFVLHDGKHLWNGQLTTQSPNEIEKAYAILKSAKHNTVKDESTK